MSKPVANRIKAGARKSEFFKNYVCLPPAQRKTQLTAANDDRWRSVSNCGGESGNGWEDPQQPIGVGLLESLPNHQPSDC